MLFRSPENSGGYTSEYIASIATASGLDMTGWNECVSGTAARAAVIAETTTDHQLGVSSTPTISLNGGPLTAGVPDASALAAQIRALASAAPSAGPSPSTSPGP